MSAGPPARPGACDPCLRRTWLVSILGPYIAKVVDRGGPRTPELLRLSDDELIAAVAGKGIPAVRRAWDALPPADCRESLDRAGVWACCRHDCLFPAGLAEAPDAPATLTGRGEPGLLVRLECAATVAVVGSRRATGYGQSATASLSRGLAAAGLVVVSGMASGIDAAAHRGALDGGGLTVAVLGGGPDRPYPASQARLYRRIAASGLVLSESPPGIRPWRWSFPARNRIMAGLARMTIVVEAAERSGSLITAGMAEDLGRDVGAVPGPVNSSLSAGANQLLRDGAAVIRGAEDVLDAMLGVGGHRLLTGPPLSRASAAVLRRVEEGLETADSLAAAGDAGAEAITAELTRLELLGYLERRPAGGYSRTMLAAPS